MKGVFREPHWGCARLLQVPSADRTGTHGLHFITFSKASASGHCTSTADTKGYQSHAQVLLSHSAMVVGHDLVFMYLALFFHVFESKD